MNKIMLVFGTRPEAIKLCPLVLELRNHIGRFQTVVCVTAQHRQMLDQVLRIFGVVPDFDLDLMTAGQDLSDLTARAIDATAKVIEGEQPDIVVVQGDTTTTFAAALAAYYHQIPVAHVEAGLRTGDKYAPFPEEINRKLTSTIADLHCAATARNRENLIAEGVPEERILVTGNTVVDALLWVRDKVRAGHTRYPELDDVDLSKRIVLVTGHRRENFGTRFLNICHALKSLAERHPDVEIVYPVHLNPNVTNPVYSMLSNTANIKLITPLTYEPFVFLMDKCFCIISDSGGIQEEAPSLGKPVLVTRDTTERPEAVDCGAATLVGSSTERIVGAAEALLSQSVSRGAGTANPFGDGRACARIVEGLAAFLSSTPGKRHNRPQPTP